MEAVNISRSLEESKFRDLAIKRIVFLIGFTINITQVILGINISVSDVFMFILLLLLLFTKSIYMTKKTTMYFIFLLIFRLLSTIQLTTWLDISISFLPIFITFQKFIISLSYFILFISCLKINSKIQDDFFKGLKYGSFILGGLSILLYFVGPEILRNIILFGDIRMRGFMNDPNYFAYMQICGFCIWYLREFKYKIINLFAVIIYPTTIFLSASKTGLVAFIFMFSILTINKIFSKQLSSASLAKLFLIISGCLILVYIFNDSIVNNLSTFTQAVPQLDRIRIVFENFSGAITEGGSGRLYAWDTANKLIVDTNFMGIGFMDYSIVAQSITGSPIIAHNTFLQLAVEWGAIPLFIGLVYLTIQIFYEVIKRNWIVVALVLTTIIFSFSISLQNARILWILLAILFANASFSNYKHKKLNEDVLIY
ncbi:O-antigen ligase family protein [Enterococcus mundtii]|uniref:O-antigen ligase family protein n=1 Tax=Enterococcus mundtii TaxID=53346 RepID=UPI0011586B47|nr:O-antigen ligase family protein [Enterococcus mundtii]